MSKGSHRRPENRAAIERNWPLPERLTIDLPYGIETPGETTYLVRTSDGWEERPGEPGKPQ